MSVVQFENYSVAIGGTEIVHDLTFRVVANAVTAIIGPSGCGKSTLLQAALRLHESVRRVETKGRVIFGGIDILRASEASLELIRKEVAYISQKPIAFPGTIYDNVALPYLYWNGKVRRGVLDDVIEEALRMASCWDDVRDRLQASAGDLSAGQLQRLAIARALVLKPPVLFLDEPCAFVDPIAAQKLEELLWELKANYTILIVTHNMQQAARISDQIAFLMLGRLVEYDTANIMLMNPRQKLTEDYVTGRFG